MSRLEARFKASRGDFSLDVDFDIPGHGVTALFGPSGCGKTTVLRCFAGLECLEKGRLVINGETWQDDNTFLRPHQRRVGYVFQEASLFPHLSVTDNLIFGQKRSRRPERLCLNDVVALLGLGGLLNRATTKLSGGERQRVAMGRAILSAPDILLMDEPMAALDKFSRDDILPYVRRLHRHLDIPVLYVTHDLGEVERLADRMILMQAGRVAAEGPLSDLLADPALPMARQPGAGVVLDGEVIEVDESYGLITLAVSGGTLQVPCATETRGGRRRIRIQASDVALCRSRAVEGSSILNGPAARITAHESYDPHRVTVFLRLGDDGNGARLLASITRKSWDALQFKPGERVHALIKSVAVSDSLDL